MAKILIAEDDKFLIAAYKAKFAKAGFDLKIVTDGKEALDALKSYTPDVMLVDLIMPNKDGFAVLEEMGKNPAYAAIPVIVASNLGQKEDVQKAKALGARDFIVKSDVSLDEIVKKVNALLP